VKASHQARLEQLEVLYSEQDYTVQSLNATVARQEKEIFRLHRSLERLDEQLRAIRKSLGGDVSPEAEKPPHY
jgi:uncharacterized coiled-coil protein SlyX